jgi:hypothetical protein
VATLQLRDPVPFTVLLKADDSASRTLTRH